MPSAMRSTLFGMGSSWGGFESLVISSIARPIAPRRNGRRAGPCLRFHIGLEDPSDLIADLERGFAAMKQAK